MMEMEDSELSLQESDLYLRSRKKVKIGEEEETCDADQDNMEEEEGDKNASRIQQQQISYKESLLNQIWLQDRPLFEVDDVVFPEESTDDENVAMEEENNQVTKSRFGRQYVPISEEEYNGWCAPWQNTLVASTNEEDDGSKDNQGHQESLQSKKKEEEFENKATLTTIKSGSEDQAADDVGVYGPWMLVKKNNEDQESDHTQRISNSEGQPNGASQNTVTRICYPKVGKNPQNFQDKRKTQGVADGINKDADGPGNKQKSAITTNSGLVDPKSTSFLALHNKILK
ncbi:hypothetical protein SESBI_37014 [Sesbania bispinosa]|nr:hypothetical protein SESBI_37014 [Sesbania bispinosa]